MTLTTILIAAIPTILGIVSTWLAWKFNPVRRIDSELDSIKKQLKGLYAIQDKALASNNNDIITITHANILELRKREDILLQRRK